MSKFNSGTSRRRFLATSAACVASTVTVGGCLSGGESTTTEQPTEVSQGSIYTTGERFGPTLVTITQPWGEVDKSIAGTLENVSDRPFTFVRIEGQFIDSENKVVGSAYAETGDLMPGQTWGWSIDPFEEVYAESFDVSSVRTQDAQTQIMEMETRDLIGAYRDRTQEAQTPPS